MGSSVGFLMMGVTIASLQAVGKVKDLMKAFTIAVTVARDYQDIALIGRLEQHQGNMIWMLTRVLE